eukprot:jgi/Bigna1/69920/fgenesh1_pg.10_\
MCYDEPHAHCYHRGDREEDKENHSVVDQPENIPWKNASECSREHRSNIHLGGETSGKKTTTHSRKNPVASTRTTRRCTGPAPTDSNGSNIKRLRPQPFMRSVREPARGLALLASILLGVPTIDAHWFQKQSALKPHQNETAMESAIDSVISVSQPLRANPHGSSAVSKKHHQKRVFETCPADGPNFPGFHVLTAEGGEASAVSYYCDTTQTEGPCTCKSGSESTIFSFVGKKVHQTCCPNEFDKEESSLACSGCEEYGNGGCNKCFGGYQMIDQRCIKCKNDRRFLDKDGHSCATYALRGWCYGGRPAPGKESLADYKYKGLSPAEACCACGGGLHSGTPFEYYMERTNGMGLVGSEFKAVPVPRTAKSYILSKDCELAKFNLTMDGNTGVISGTPMHDEPFAVKCTVTARNPSVSESNKLNPKYIDTNHTIEITIHSFGYSSTDNPSYGIGSAVTFDEYSFSREFQPVWAPSKAANYKYSMTCAPKSFVAIDEKTGIIYLKDTSTAKDYADLFERYKGMMFTNNLTTPSGHETVMRSSCYVTAVSGLQKHSLQVSVFAYPPSKPQTITFEPSASIRVTVGQPIVVPVKLGALDRVEYSTNKVKDIEGQFSVNLDCSSTNQLPVEYDMATGNVNIHGLPVINVHPITGKISGSPHVGLREFMPSTRGRASITLRCEVYVGIESASYLPQVRLEKSTHPLVVQIDDDHCWVRAPGLQYGDYITSVRSQESSTEKDVIACKLKCLKNKACPGYSFNKKTKRCSEIVLSRNKGLLPWAAEDLPKTSELKIDNCQLHQTCVYVDVANQAYISGLYCPVVHSEKAIPQPIYVKPKQHEEYTFYLQQFDKSTTAKLPSGCTVANTDWVIRKASSKGDDIINIEKSYVETHGGIEACLTTPINLGPDSEVSLLAVSSSATHVYLSSSSSNATNGPQPNLANNRTSAKSLADKEAFYMDKDKMAAAALSSTKSGSATAKKSPATGAPTAMVGGRFLYDQVPYADSESSIKNVVGKSKAVIYPVGRGCNLPIEFEDPDEDDSSEKEENGEEGKEKKQEIDREAATGLITDTSGSEDENIKKAVFVFDDPNTEIENDYHLHPCECFFEPWGKNYPVDDSAFEAASKGAMTSGASFNRLLIDRHHLWTAPHVCDTRFLLSQSFKDGDSCATDCGDDPRCNFFGFLETEDGSACVLYSDCKNMVRVFGTEVTVNMYAKPKQKGQTRLCHIANPQKCWEETKRRAYITGMDSPYGKCEWEDLAIQCDVNRLLADSKIEMCAPCTYMNVDTQDEKMVMPPTLPHGTQLTVSCLEGRYSLIKAKGAGDSIVCMDGEWIDTTGAIGLTNMQCSGCVMIFDPSTKAVEMQNAVMEELMFMEYRSFGVFQLQHESRPKWIEYSFRSNRIHERVSDRVPGDFGWRITLDGTTALQMSLPPVEGRKQYKKECLGLHDYPKGSRKILDVLSMEQCIMTPKWENSKEVVVPGPPSVPLRIGSTIGLFAISVFKYLKPRGNTISLSPVASPKGIPARWKMERFKIVDAGNGLYAFWNMYNKRFLDMPQGTSQIRWTSYSPHGRFDPSFETAMFKVMPGRDGHVGLWNHYNRRFLRVRPDNGAVDRSGEVKDSNLPQRWTWELIDLVYLDKSGLMLETGTEEIYESIADMKVIDASGQQMMEKEQKDDSRDDDDEEGDGDEISSANSQPETAAAALTESEDSSEAAALIESEDSSEADAFNSVLTGKKKRPTRKPTLRPTRYPTTYPTLHPTRYPIGSSSITYTPMQLLERIGKQEELINARRANVDWRCPESHVGYLQSFGLHPKCVRMRRSHHTGSQVYTSMFAKVTMTAKCPPGEAMWAFRKVDNYRMEFKCAPLLGMGACTMERFYQISKSFTPAEAMRDAKLNPECPRHTVIGAVEVEYEKADEWNAVKLSCCMHPSYSGAMISPLPLNGMRSYEGIYCPTGYDSLKQPKMVQTLSFKTGMVSPRDYEPPVTLLAAEDEEMEDEEDILSVDDEAMEQHHDEISSYDYDEFVNRNTDVKLADLMEGEVYTGVNLKAAANPDVDREAAASADLMEGEEHTAFDLVGADSEEIYNETTAVEEWAHDDDSVDGRTWFCVARMNKRNVEGPYRTVAQAQRVLNKVRGNIFNRQMVCEMRNGKAKRDPHRVGGRNQGAGARGGFQKYWFGWHDINILNHKCSHSKACRRVGPARTRYPTRYPTPYSTKQYHWCVARRAQGTVSGPYSSLSSARAELNKYDASSLNPQMICQITSATKTARANPSVLNSKDGMQRQIAPHFKAYYRGKDDVATMNKMCLESKPCRDKRASKAPTLYPTPAPTPSPNSGTWFCVVGLQRRSVDGPYRTVEAARLALNRRVGTKSNKQMVCNIGLNGYARSNVGTVGGMRQSKDADKPFYSYWSSQSDINQMNALCKADMRCKSGMLHSNKVPTIKYKKTTEQWCLYDPLEKDASKERCSKQNGDTVHPMEVNWLYETSVGTKYSLIGFKPMIGDGMTSDAKNGGAAPGGKPQKPAIVKFEAAQPEYNEGCLKMEEEAYEEATELFTEKDACGIVAGTSWKKWGKTDETTMTAAVENDCNQRDIERAWESAKVHLSFEMVSDTIGLVVDSLSVQCAFLPDVSAGGGGGLAGPSFSMGFQFSQTCDRAYALTSAIKDFAVATAQNGYDMHEEREGYDDCNPMQNGFNLVLCDLYCLRDAVRAGTAAVIKNIELLAENLMTNIDMLMDYYSQVTMLKVEQEVAKVAPKKKMLFETNPAELFSDFQSSVEKYLLPPNVHEEVETAHTEAIRVIQDAHGAVKRANSSDEADSVVADALERADSLLRRAKSLYNSELQIARIDGKGMMQRRQNWAKERVQRTVNSMNNTLAVQDWAVQMQQRVSSYFLTRGERLIRAYKDTTNGPDDISLSKVGVLNRKLDKLSEQLSSFEAQQKDRDTKKALEDLSMGWIRHRDRLNKYLDLARNELSIYQKSFASIKDYVSCNDQRQQQGGNALIKRMTSEANRATAESQDLLRSLWTKTLEMLESQSNMLAFESLPEQLVLVAADSIGHSVPNDKGKSSEENHSPLVMKTAADWLTGSKISSIEEQFAKSFDKLPLDLLQQMIATYSDARFMHFRMTRDNGEPVGKQMIQIECSSDCYDQQDVDRYLAAFKGLLDHYFQHVSKLKSPEHAAGLLQRIIDQLLVKSFPAPNMCKELAFEKYNEDSTSQLVALATLAPGKYLISRPISPLVTLGANYSVKAFKGLLSQPLPADFPRIRKRPFHDHISVIVYVNAAGIMFGGSAVHLLQSMYVCSVEANKKDDKQKSLIESQEFKWKLERVTELEHEDAVLLCSEGQSDCNGDKPNLVQISSMAGQNFAKTMSLTNFAQFFEEFPPLEKKASK